MRKKEREELRLGWMDNNLDMYRLLFWMHHSLNNEIDFNNIATGLLSL